MKPRIGFVRKYARELLKRHGISGPPVDLQILLKKEGLDYQEVDYFPDDVDALIIPFEGRVIAAVNQNHHINRRRFSLAHELCHHLLHQDRSVLEDRITIDTDLIQEQFHSKDVYEAEADIFAGELLVPLPFLKKEYKKGLVTADIALIFQVSEQVAAIAISNHFSSLFKL
jgi:Zn-dependent peptidase ImmA (M78 family)